MVGAGPRPLSARTPLLCCSLSTAMDLAENTRSANGRRSTNCCASLRVKWSGANTCFPRRTFSDDGIRIGGPDEGFGVVIGFSHEAVDGGLVVGDAHLRARGNHSLASSN